jgi:hypothetical protein
MVKRSASTMTVCAAAFTVAAAPVPPAAIGGLGLLAGLVCIRLRRHSKR